MRPREVSFASRKSGSMNAMAFVLFTPAAAAVAATAATAIEVESAVI